MRKTYQRFQKIPLVPTHAYSYITATAMVRERMVFRFGFELDIQRFALPNNSFGGIYELDVTIGGQMSRRAWCPDHGRGICHELVAERVESGHPSPA
jgi:hypothetical protein